MDQSPDPILGALLDNESLATPDLSVRPYRLPGHIYAYTANSPINLVDPTGLLESDSVAQRPRANSVPSRPANRPQASRPRAGSVPSRSASPSPPPVAASRPPAAAANDAPVTRQRAQSAPLPRREAANDAPAGRSRAQSAPARLETPRPQKNEKTKFGIDLSIDADGATSGGAPSDHTVNVFSGAPGAILEATPLLDAREALNLEAGFGGPPVREVDDGRPVYDEPRRRSPGEGSR